MNKEELVKSIKEKGITEEEITIKLAEITEWLTKKGITGKQLEQSALARLQSYYKKLKGQVFEGVIFGIDRITDYGARKLYEQAKQAYKEDQAEAIAQGFTDEEGKPLYSGTRAPKDGSLRYINLEKDRAKTVFLLIATKGTTIQEAIKQGTAKKAMLNLKPDNFDATLPMLKYISFRAQLSTKTTEDKIILNDAGDISIKVLDKQQLDLPELVEKFLKDNICENLNDIEKWLEKHKEDKNRMIVLRSRKRKDNITYLNVSSMNIGESNKITIDSSDLIGKPAVTCWVPPDVEINFDETAMDIIVIGRPSTKEDKFSGENVVSINAVNFWCPPLFRVEKTEEDKIKEEEITEETIEEEEIKEDEVEETAEEEEDSVEEEVF